MNADIKSHDFREFLDIEKGKPVSLILADGFRELCQAIRQLEKAYGNDKAFKAFDDASTKRASYLYYS